MAAHFERIEKSVLVAFILGVLSAGHVRKVKTLRAR